MQEKSRTIWVRQSTKDLLDQHKVGDESYNSMLSRYFKDRQHERTTGQD